MPAHDTSHDHLGNTDKRDREPHNKINTAPSQRVTGNRRTEVSLPHVTSGKHSLDKLHLLLVAASLWVASWHMKASRGSVPPVDCITIQNISVWNVPALWCGDGFLYRFGHHNFVCLFVALLVFRMGELGCKYQLLSSVPAFGVS